MDNTVIIVLGKLAHTGIIHSQHTHTQSAMIHSDLPPGVFLSLFIIDKGEAEGGAMGAVEAFLSSLANMNPSLSHPLFHLPLLHSSVATSLSFLPSSERIKQRDLYDWQHSQKRRLVVRQLSSDRLRGNPVTHQEHSVTSLLCTPLLCLKVCLWRD